LTSGGLTGALPAKRAYDALPVAGTGPRQLPDRTTAKKLKIEKDDIAVLNGKLYRVLVVGLRFARLQDLQTGETMGLAKLTDCRKFVAGATDNSPLDEVQSCGTFDLAAFKKRNR
jgi:hypothetical protein